MVESFESINYEKMKEMKEIFRENKILYSNQNQMTQSLGHRGTEAQRHGSTKARKHEGTETQREKYFIILLNFREL